MGKLVHHSCRQFESLYNRVPSRKLSFLSVLVNVPMTKGNAQEFSLRKRIADLLKDTESPVTLKLFRDEFLAVTQINGKTSSTCGRKFKDYD